MMSSSISVGDDFAQLADGIISVELCRRDSSDKVTVTFAKSQSVVTSEASPSGGSAQQANAVWHLQLPTGESAPRIGDVVIDGEGRRWTILEVRELSLLGRWKCEKRDLSVAFGCLDRVDVERAVWGDLGSGPEIVDWIYVYTALPVRIQPDKTVLDNSSDPPKTKSMYQIIFSESIALEPEDRFVAEDGTVYLLQSYSNAERIDALPLANVLRKDD